METRSGDHTLYFEGDALYDDMLAAIARAEARVWMESYIFSADGDPVGRRFGAALARAARRGLDVRLHVDAVGSLFQLPTDFIVTLRRAGVQLRTFHRWSWRDPWRYNRRNHCKVLIIDQERVFLGGFNIHRESSSACVGEARWRDTHIGLDDPKIVAQADDLFTTFWTRRVSRDLRRRRLPRRFRGDALVSNRLPRHRLALRRLYHHGIRRARQRVLLTTPYFAPDRRTRAHLYAAASRGVTVRLLLPAVSDQWLVRMAARHIYTRLLRRGIELYEYCPRTLHAKTMVVDGRLATIGTANLDYRSFTHNYEINFVTNRPAVCAELEAQFQRDLEQAERVTEAHLGRRRWWERLAGVFAWRLRRLL